MGILLSSCLAINTVYLLTATNKRGISINEAWFAAKIKFVSKSLSCPLIISFTLKINDNVLPQTIAKNLKFFLFS